QVVGDLLRPYHRQPPDGDLRNSHFRTIGRQEIIRARIPVGRDQVNMFGVRVRLVRVILAVRYPSSYQENILRADGESGTGESQEVLDAQRMLGNAESELVLQLVNIENSGVVAAPVRRSPVIPEILYGVVRRSFKQQG